VRQYRVPALEKAMAILELLAQSDRELTATEIHQEVGIPKATAFMVLRQPQGAYEDAVSAIRLSVPVVLVREGEAHRVTRRS